LFHRRNNTIVVLQLKLDALVGFLHARIRLSLHFDDLHHRLELAHLLHYLCEVAVAEGEILRLLQDAVEAGLQPHELLPVALVLERVIAQEVSVGLRLHHL